MRSEAQHVYPDNDLREHETGGEEFWCDPEYGYINGGWIVIHNSADGREMYQEQVRH